MSNVDNLIAEMCPDGIESKALGDIAELVRGNGMPKTMLTDAGIGAIHYGQIYTRYGTWTTSTHSFVASEDAVKLAKADPGDIIITNTSENIGDEGKAVAWLGDTPIVTGGHATVIKHGLDPKYFSYWFQSPSFSKQKRALAAGTKVIDVSAKQLSKVRVPVPPVEVQREIVRLLDHFAALETELETKLETELDARRRQYEHHRNSLTQFKSRAVEKMPMGALGTFTRGRRFTKNDFAKEGIPRIHYGEIYTHYGVSTTSTFSHVRKDLHAQLRFAQPGDVVIAAVSETVEDVAKAVAYLGDQPVAIHDDTFSFRGSLHPKFVSYYLQTAEFHAQKNRHVSRAKVKRLSADGLAKIVIPAPEADEQMVVVAILDKFDALVTDLSASLRAELAARRQQHEHYRDRLLTFQEFMA